MGKISLPPEDALFIADTATARAWMNSEWQLGVITKWPDTFQKILGANSISMTQDPELHKQLREIMVPYFTSESIQRLMPGIQGTVRKHMARWAAQDTFNGYTSAKMMTFEVISNKALALGFTDSEIQEYSEVFRILVNGFMPPAINLPFTAFGKGLKAKQQLVERIQVALASARLPADSMLARFRDEWGPKDERSTDNVITLLFAGHDTTSSAISYLLWQLNKHPAVLEKLREEQAAVQAKHGSDLSPAAIAAMKYTAAVVKETLRLAHVIAYIPRHTTKDIQAPTNGPRVPSGCPFVMALAAISSADPAVATDAEEFRPERWLDQANSKTLSQYQLPFGIGQHYCVGSHLAQAELTAVISELASGYKPTVDPDVEWVDFPIKQPKNGLLCKLEPLTLTAI
eukprot:GHRR01003841.1.p1 GENE.GHRR01003841.1~~GHRR01003841.1.p1  ORF type:complete len:402 (+),score=99.42 GHRR01003841.1:454-1659(+)